MQAASASASKAAAARGEAARLAPRIIAARNMAIVWTKKLPRCGVGRLVIAQMSLPVSVYRIFRRGDGGAPSVRAVVIALVVVAALATAIGVIRVSRRHEVLRLGYELARRSEQVHQLREARRQLELEHATLSAPDRIRGLATRLGMMPVSPDRIRVIGRGEVAAR